MNFGRLKQPLRKKAKQSKLSFGTKKIQKFPKYIPSKDPYRDRNKGESTQSSVNSQESIRSEGEDPLEKVGKSSPSKDPKMAQFSSFQALIKKSKTQLKENYDHLI